MYGSSNIVRKFSVDDIDKMGYCRQYVVFKTNIYGITMYGSVPYSHANNHIFIRFLGFDKNNKIISDNEMLIVEKIEVVRAIR